MKNKPILNHHSNNSIVILIFALSIFVVMNSTYVTSSDVWDRPLIIFNVTPFVINFTDNLNDLQQQIININNTFLYENSSIWLELGDKLNTSDQRYNDTTLILNINSTLSTYIGSVNLTVTNIETNLDDLNNSFYNYVNITNINITNLFNNITYIQTQIDNKLNTSDQRYNDTNLIYTINETQYNFTFLVNQTLYEYINNQTQEIYQNLTINTDNIYIYKTTINNITLNETKLNQTITSIAKINVYTETYTFNTTTNPFTFISNYSEYLITKISVHATTTTNKFRFNATEYTTNDVIDSDKKKHTGIWIIEKNYAINDNITLNIYEQDILEVFNVTITRIDNAIEP